MALNKHCVKWISCFLHPQIPRFVPTEWEFTCKRHEVCPTPSKFCDLWSFFGQCSLFLVWAQVNKPIQVLSETSIPGCFCYIHIYPLPHFSPSLCNLKGTLDGLNYRQKLQLETDSCFDQSKITDAEKGLAHQASSAMADNKEQPMHLGPSSFSFHSLGLIRLICGQEAPLTHGRHCAATLHVAPAQWATGWTGTLLGELLSHPFLSKAATSSTLMPKMNRFSSPASSAISTLAPSMVPMVRAPFSINFILPVPEASVPAVEICSDKSVAGMTALRQAC